MMFGWYGSKDRKNRNCLRDGLSFVISRYLRIFELVIFVTCNSFWLTKEKAHDLQDCKVSTHFHNQSLITILDGHFLHAKTERDVKHASHKNFYLYEKQGKVKRIVVPWIQTDDVNLTYIMLYEQFKQHNMGWT